MNLLLLLSILLRFSQSEHHGKDEFGVDGELKDFFDFTRQFVEFEDDRSPLELAFPSTYPDEHLDFTSIVTMCSFKLVRVWDLKMCEPTSQRGPLTIIRSDRRFQCFEENFEHFECFSS
jgi:hypothetical protein